MLTNELKKSWNLLLCAGALALTSVGCAADMADMGEEGADGQALQAPPTQATKPDPNKAFFAEVTANGTGCPKGTWLPDISPDGLTFNILFSSYETSVDESTSMDVADCQLAIKLRSPNGLSYSVSEFSYTGYAFLERGVNFQQSANYYFQGNPVVPVTTRTNLTGPYDDAYLFVDKIGTADAVWSPCGLDRNLNVTTRLRLRNSSPRRQAYANLTAVDAQVQSKLVIKLAFRSCR